MGVAATKACSTIARECEAENHDLPRCEAAKCEADRCEPEQCVVDRHEVEIHRTTASQEQMVTPGRVFLPSTARNEPALSARVVDRLLGRYGIVPPSPRPWGCLPADNPKARASIEGSPVDDLRDMMQKQKQADAALAAQSAVPSTGASVWPTKRI